MKILVEINCPENWREDYFDYVKGILEEAQFIDLESIEVA